MKKKLLKQIVSIISKNVGEGIVKIFLFGSRVEKRNVNPRADVDIGIIAREKLSFKILNSISEEIDKLPTLIKIDVVDFTDRNDIFTEEALKKIEVLYEKKETT